jgi:hypothetical protein
MRVERAGEALHFLGQRAVTQVALLVAVLGADHEALPTNQLQVTTDRHRLMPILARVCHVHVMHGAVAFVAQQELALAAVARRRATDAATTGAASIAVARSGDFRAAARATATARTGRAAAASARGARLRRAPTHSRGCCSGCSDRAARAARVRPCAAWNFRRISTSHRGPRAECKEKREAWRESTKRGSVRPAHLRWINGVAPGNPSA